MGLGITCLGIVGNSCPKATCEATKKLPVESKISYSAAFVLICRCPARLSLRARRARFELGLRWKDQSPLEPLSAAATRALSRVSGACSTISN